MRSLDEDFKYIEMSAVQEQVLKAPANDLLVRAKTGTGKTLAFLIASIEECIKTESFGARRTPILIVSPTRELASQVSF